MFATNDTIVAIATPHGRGALGIVRLSGHHAEAIVQGLIGSDRHLAPRMATLARLRSSEMSQEAVLDEVVVTFFPGPRSTTGENVVEISAHGSPVVLDAIVRGAVARGARPAAPGEFTLRAFLNGKRDLIRCEAVRDLIDAVCDLLPRAGDASFREARVGLRPGTPDGLPILGPSTVHPRLVFATGHYRNGILLAPLTAKMVAAVVVDGVLDPMLRAARPNRFGQL